MPPSVIPEWFAAGDLTMGVGESGFWHEPIMRVEPVEASAFVSAVERKPERYRSRRTAEVRPASCRRPCGPLPERGRYLPDGRRPSYSRTGSLFHSAAFFGFSLASTSQPISPILRNPTRPSSVGPSARMESSLAVDLGTFPR
jgi:hypothetical protein